MAGKGQQAGQRVAYVSDAGTPAVSDPGAHLVQAAQAAGLTVVPLPGASSITTAFVGFLGSERNGQRLALAHVLFNIVTALLSLLLFVPLSWLVLQSTAWVGLGDNGLIQLALFHTLFNVLGVLVFWRWQGQLAAKLQQWLPERAEQQLPTLIAEPRNPPCQQKIQHRSGLLKQKQFARLRYRGIGGGE